MKTKNRKKLKCSGSVQILFMAAGIIFLYAFFAYPVYTRIKIGALQEAFRQISDMDLSSLAEEDEEILLGYYQDDRMEITVTDTELQVIYVNRPQNTESYIEKNIKDHLEDFKEQPTVHIRRNKSLRVIRLRGLVTQEEGPGAADSADDGTHPGTVSYYVYIRKEMRGEGELIQYTAYYLIIMLILCAGVWRFRQKRSGMGSEAAIPEAGGVSAEDLVQAQKEFVANISHELKTPLAVISGQVEMLQSMGDGIDRDYYFSSIREEIDKMSDMVGNLLDITIMEHHMEKMEMDEVNLSDMMNYMILKYDALFRQNKIRRKTELTENCIVRANHMYLEQAINNYIMNAFQHTAQGKEIGIRLVRERSFATVYIYNDGQRIAPEEMERIWQGFYMGMGDRNHRKNQNIPNAGLGLYMVKKIVEQHQGSCGVENKEHGVEFWMRIPLV